LYAAPRLAVKYIHYYLTAANGKGHGIHSPFVYDFIVHVLNDKKKYAQYKTIESRRKHLLKDNRLLQVEDFGAGPVKGYQKQRTIEAIAKSALKPPKLAQLLFRIIQYYKPAAMIELGTSLGMTATYLAMGNPSGKLVTCEGSVSIAAVAKENFYSLQIPNIEIATGNFDDSLPLVLNKLGSIDFAFVDGNHRAAPTLHYFEQLLQKTNRPAILIFDDIHWSAGMESAWRQIKNHPVVMLTIDLFFLGIVFLNPDFKVKQDFVIRF
jgi:predicted O-methyltransferase YrrM